MKSLFSAPTRIREVLDRVKDSIWFPRDVYSVSFPKTGRTYVHLMMAHVCHQLTGTPVEDIVNGRALRLADRKSGLSIPGVHYQHLYKWKQFRCGAAFPAYYYYNRRVVHLIRDPRDVIVSHYHHRKHRDKLFNGTLSEFVRYSWSGDPADHKPASFGIEPIVRYYNAWAENRRLCSDFLCLQYESFHDDAPGTLTRLLNFAGFQVSDEVVKAAVEYASFGNMQKMELERQIRWKGLSEGNNAASLKARQGKVGGYRDHLSPEDLSWMNHFIEQNLSSDYKFYKHETLRRAC